MNQHTPEDLPYELRALEAAVRYQQWIIATIKPFLGKRILEIGAGNGNMSRWLKAADHLVVTESSQSLLHLLEKNMRADNVYVRQFNAEQDHFDAFTHDNFDTIISFNVLEHINHDIEVLRQCAELLRLSKAPGKKRLITFVPAHAWAYGAMDKQVGHYRRYCRKTFRELHEKTAPDATLMLKPFNFVGLWGWILNGRILKRPAAGTGMISIFEILCPAIQLIDKLVIDTVGIPLGQSLLAIQEFKQGASHEY